MGIGYLFYRCLIGAVISLLLLPVYTIFDGKERCRKRSAELKNEFKDELLAISACMQAGMSIERAVRKSLDTVRNMYPKDAPIITAVERSIHKIDCNMSVEAAFLELGDEIDLQEVTDFGQILITAKRTGGNIVDIIAHTASAMEMRAEVEREIDTLLAGKRYEARLMNVMPLGILLYLSVGMPEISKQLYGNAVGVCIMTVGLGIYITAFLWTEKILREVV